MAYADIGTTFGTAFTGNAAAAKPAQPGIIARLVAAITASREAHSRREIARHAWLISELKTSRQMTQRCGLPF